MQDFSSSQILAIAAVHLLAVTSPGPDFAMVLRQSVRGGRACGLWTSLGTTLGIMFHITYTLLGIGLIISKSIMLFNVMKIGGALFLIYMGIQALRARKHDHLLDRPVEQAAEGIEIQPYWWRALGTGFLTNALNPKATLFFLSVFSVVLNPHNGLPPLVLGLVVAYMLVVHLLWYVGLTFLFTLQPFLRAYQRISHWIERTMGAVLVVLGLKLLTWHRG